MLASKLVVCEFVFVAEVMALKWATGELAHQGWNKVIWSMDSKMAIKGVLSTKDLKGWSTRHILM